MSSIGDIYSQLRYLTVGGGSRKVENTVVGGDLPIKQRALANADAQGVGRARSSRIGCEEMGRERDGRVR